MKTVKVLRDCIIGKKGAIVEVADHIAKQRIADGAVEEYTPKAKRSGRKKIEDKALTASKG